MESIVLMMSDNHGIYIPQNFVNDVDINAWHVKPEDAEILAAGPDNEGYWDAWDSVLNDAYYMHGDAKYTLHQDGDLWAVCPDRMTNEEYSDFFGEMNPAPDGAHEFAVCEDCLIAIANDDYSGMSEDQEKATREGIEYLTKEYGYLIPDGAEYGFSHRRCECCDGLPGDRYRVISFGKGNKS